MTPEEEREADLWALAILGFGPWVIVLGIFLFTHFVLGW